MTGWDEPSRPALRVGKNPTELLAHLLFGRAEVRGLELTHEACDERYRTVLRLVVETSAAWAERASQAMEEILLDHCHLEKKAASTALNLIFRYPEHPELAIPLSELAREELEHFELVFQTMKARHIPYARIRPAPYAGKLMAVVRTDEPHRLMDTLLCCALIEARSCERMKLLSEHLQDRELQGLYEGLLASEARHHGLYVRLARTLFDKEEVEERLSFIANHEASVLKEAPLEPRMHNR